MEDPVRGEFGEKPRYRTHLTKMHSRREDSESLVARTEQVLDLSSANIVTY